MSGPSRSGARVAALLFLTFAAGFAAGLVIERGVLAPGRAAPPAASARGEGQTTIERFADELRLTEEQRARIRPILEETRRRLGELFAEVRPQYHTVVDSARDRIEEVLTPEQVARYRQLLEQQKGAEERSESGEQKSREEGGQ